MLSGTDRPFIIIKPGGDSEDNVEQRNVLQSRKRLAEKDEQPSSRSIKRCNLTRVGERDYDSQLQVDAEVRLGLESQSSKDKISSPQLAQSDTSSDKADKGNWDQLQVPQQSTGTQSVLHSCSDCCPNWQSDRVFIAYPRNAANRTCTALCILRIFKRPKCDPMRLLLPLLFEHDVISIGDEREPGQLYRFGRVNRSDFFKLFIPQTSFNLFALLGVIVQEQLAVVFSPWFVVTQVDPYFPRVDAAY